MPREESEAATQKPQDALWLVAAARLHNAFQVFPWIPLPAHSTQTDLTLTKPKHTHTHTSSVKLPLVERVDTAKYPNTVSPAAPSHRNLLMTQRGSHSHGRGQFSYLKLYPVLSNCFPVTFLSLLPRTAVIGQFLCLLLCKQRGALSLMPPPLTTQWRKELQPLHAHSQNSINTSTASTKKPQLKYGGS